MNLGYDSFNRLLDEAVTQSVGSGGTTLTDTQYSYDQANNRTFKEVTEVEAPPAR